MSGCSIHVLPPKPPSMPALDPRFFPADLVQPTRKRRQYHSCDACRHARRACDARDLPSPPCSNCRKAARECKFEWLRSVPTAPAKKAKSQKQTVGKAVVEGRPAPALAHPPILPAPPASTATTGAISQETTSVGLAATRAVSSYLGDGYEDVGAPQWSAHPPDYHIPITVNSNLHTQFVTQSESATATPATRAWLGAPSYQSLGPLSSMQTLDFTAGGTFSSQHASDNNTEWASMLGGHLAGPRGNDVDPTAFDSMTAITSPTFDSMTDIVESMPSTRSGPMISQQRYGSRENTCGRAARHVRASPSSLQGLNSQLALNTNRMQIASTFVKIYTDSFEHLLSCWVARSACPYNVTPSPSSPPSVDQGLAGYFEPQLRFHDMVCRLHAKFGPLARSFDKMENLEAKRTLQKTIMAFASQWSPHNPAPTRGRNRKISSEDVHGGDSIDVQCAALLGSPLSFNRIMQESLWHEAHRSIQSMRDTGSFCAILAHMIFALTQQPIAASGATTQALRSKLDARSKSPRDWDRSQGNVTPSSPPGRGTTWRFDIAQVLMDADGSPTFLEIALRHLHTWRRRLACLSTSEAHQPGQASVAGAPSKEDTEDFNLLFWFGLMCDTTCAAISNRPLIISDEDCARDLELDHGAVPTQHLHDSNQQDQPLTPFDRTTRLEPPLSWPLNWGQPGGHHGDCLNGLFRWPFSLTDAAIRLRDGTQVKVLFLRRVTALQALVDRPVPAAKVEVALQDALEVYETFNSTYGRFIQDCIHHHDDVPARFQSWYVIFGVHWHLGVLLLADAIEAIDRRGRLEPASRKARQESRLVSQLRASSAYAIAELSRASSSSRESAKQYQIDGGFAFNHGAFLAEPWADILVRALARAASIFLDLIGNHGRHGGREDADEMLANSYCQNTEHCILGLQQLGVKSDLAYLLAAQLSAELDLRLQGTPSSPFEW